MEDVRLFDTASRSIKPLLAADGKVLKFYACGPTVYGPAHIGNFRTFLAQDLLVRVWQEAGGKVQHVRNLTDVDDKTIRGARRPARSWEISPKGGQIVFGRMAWRLDCSSQTGSLGQPSLFPSRFP